MSEEFLLLNRDATERPISPLGKISIDGKRFIVNGKTWKYHSVTTFTLLKNFIDGKDISSFFRFAHSINANTLRVFGMLSWADLYPQYINNYYSWLDDFITHCARNGFYVEFCAFASANEVMPSFSRQIDYYMNCAEVLSGHDNILLSCANENDLSVNNINLERFPTINNLPCSSGSNGGDVDPPEPIKHFTEFHPGRSYEWPRKVKSAREFADKYNVPCINNETNRPDLADYNVSDFSDCGYVSGLLTAGTNSHSESLKRCQVPTGKEFDCVNAILQSSVEVDNDVYLGSYTRGGLPNCPMFHRDDMALRTFAILGDHRAWAVIVRPSNDNPRKAVNGWEITYQKNNYFELRRA